MLLDGSIERLLVAGIHREGLSRARELGAEVLGSLKGAAGHRELEVGSAQDVLGGGLSDEAGAHEEDLLGGLVGRGLGAAFSDGGAKELWLDERGLVDGWGPVAGGGDVAHRLLEVALFVEGGHEEADGA